jgi:hypothetical protein
MRHRTTIVIAALLTGVPMGFAVAAPGPSTLTLDWGATPECVSGSRVLDDVARLVGGASEGNRRVAARARLTQTDRGAWHVVLTTQTEEGARDRSFDAESCEAAAGGIAFILATTENPAVAASRSAELSSTPLAALPPLPALEPPAAASEREPPTSPPVRAEADAPAREALSVPEETRTDARGRVNARRGFEGIVAVGIATDSGTLPRTTLGPIASVGLAQGRWRFDLTSAYWTSKSATLPAGPAGARFDAWSAEARAALGWPLGPFKVGPVAGLGIESIYAAGFGGTAANFDVNALTGTLGGGGFLSWRPGGAMALRLEVEGEVPFERPSFHVNEPVPPNSLVFRLPAAVARASLGVDVVF